MASKSGSGPTFELYLVIFFLLVSIVLGVVLYLTISDAGKVAVTLKDTEAKLQASTTTLGKLDDSLQQIKKLLGKSTMEVNYDAAAPNNPASVYGSMDQDNREYGKELAETTVAGTLKKLREALNAVTTERDSKTAALAESEKETLALRARYQTTADDHKNARTAAEGTLRTTVNERDEQIAAKDQQIGELRNLYNTSQVELEQEKEAREKDRVKAQNEIDKLVLINEKIRSELDEIKQESFEVPDGKIRRVDNVSRLVWIDIGDADFLKPRMTFSIYSKETPGVARTTADIKGKIEVTRVIGPHLAEAKIIEEDLYRPMSPGDFIYTPLWSPGRAERFAIVGQIDLDGDGQSDRALFQQEMAVRGAEIVDEVDDEGNRPTPSIDESIKYLIMGKVADIADATLSEDEQKIKQITDHQATMRKEARLYGVRIIPLNSFLDYIGYKSKRRLFKPGDNRGYNLKAGAASTGVNEPLGDRSSSGQVSGSYGAPSRAVPPQTSSGTTSKLFGGK